MPDNTSKKSAKPSKPTSIPKMIDTPLAIQGELRLRYDVRYEISQAIKLLDAALKAWVDDIEVDDRQYFEAFNAMGHQGEYDEYPKGTLARKLHDLGWTEEQISTINTIKTPLDLMSVDELHFALQRIQIMLKWFADHPQGGTFHRACEMYKAVGELVKRLVVQKTGHTPEQFSTPGVIITGDKSEVKRLKPTPYRAPLFPDDEVES